MTEGEKVPFCFLGRFLNVKKGALFVVWQGVDFS